MRLFNTFWINSKVRSRKILSIQPFWEICINYATHFTQHNNDTTSRMFPLYTTKYPIHLSLSQRCISELHQADERVHAPHRSPPSADVLRQSQAPNKSALHLTRPLRSWSCGISAAVTWSCLMSVWAASIRTCWWTGDYGDGPVLLLLRAPSLRACVGAVP